MWTLHLKQRMLDVMIIWIGCWTAKKLAVEDPEDASVTYDAGGFDNVGDVHYVDDTVERV